jgi:hypothetical protein
MRPPITTAEELLPPGSVAPKGSSWWLWTQPCQDGMACLPVSSRFRRMNFSSLETLTPTFIKQKHCRNPYHREHTTFGACKARGRHRCKNLAYKRKVGAARPLPEPCPATVSPAIGVTGAAALSLTYWEASGLAACASRVKRPLPSSQTINSFSTWPAQCLLLPQLPPPTINILFLPPQPSERASTPQQSSQQRWMDEWQETR